jgi:peptidoglycan/LPS O-acetylase OafA/YrhL
MHATAQTPSPSSSQPACPFVDNLQGKRLPCLDGLRGIAAYMVVLVHIHLLRLYNLGPFAVDVFFVISGFLISLLLIGEAERTGDVSLKKFYIRRTLRIFPAFYISWAFTLAVGLLLRQPFGRMEPVATFFYMGDYYHALYGGPSTLMLLAWSLGVEEKFYLLWPAVFVMLVGRWSALFKCCLGAMGLIWLHKLVLLYVFHAPYRYFEYAFDMRVDMILAGCALALATRLPEARRWFNLLAGRPWWILGTMALLVPTVIAVEPNDHDRIPGYFTTWVQLQTLLIPLLFIQLVAWSDRPLLRWLSSPTARLFGNLSYGIYLYHRPLIWLLQKYLVGHWKAMRLLELVLPAAVSYVSYRFLERPFLRLKDRFAGG